MKRNLIISIIAIVVIAILIFVFIGKKTKFLEFGRADGIFNNASLAQKENRIEEAIKDYQLLISNYPEAKKTPQALHNLALIYKAEGDFQQAKAAFVKLIEGYPDSPLVNSAWADMTDINMKLLLSPTITQYSSLYEVKPGDSLTKIAKEFDTTVELIKRSNNLKSDRIVPGAKLKVITGKFSTIIDKSQNTLVLKLGQDVLKTYRVATGKNNSTPTGSFEITNKLKNPPWFKPGSPQPIPPDSPDNILGTRWMGLSVPQPGYGIHGTNDADSIGKQVTEGCIRLTNQDVEELFDMVPVGSEVTVVD